MVEQPEDFPESIPMLTERVMTNWGIYAIAGGEICLIGAVDGASPVKTTAIITVERGKVTTASGSIYRIARRDMSREPWEIILQRKRPEWYKKLLQAKVI